MLPYYWKQIPKTKMRKEDQVWYGKGKFGFFVKMQKIHIDLKTSDRISKRLAPYGAKKGQVLVGLWNPNIGLSGGGVNKANVYIPKSKIRKVMRSYKKRK